MTLSNTQRHLETRNPGYNVPECTVFTVPEKQNTL